MGFSIMQAAMDLTLEYTHERYQFGKPIATMQLMQGKLAGELFHSTRKSQAARSKFGNLS